VKTTINKSAKIIIIILKLMKRMKLQDKTIIILKIYMIKLMRGYWYKVQKRNTQRYFFYIILHSKD